MQCAAGATGIAPPVSGRLGAGALYGVDSYGALPSYINAHFDCTYLSGYPGGKDWTYEARASWVGRGKGACEVWETSATRAYDGYSAGQSDARAAAYESARVGFPTYVPIRFAVDTEASGASIRSYFQGVHSILGSRTGAYGSYYVITGLESYGLITPRTAWQTVAWSYGHRSNACLYQASINNWLDGHSVDSDYATCQDYGQEPVTQAKPNLQHYERYDSRYRKLRGTRMRERNTVEAWDKNHCENPAKRPVCKATNYHIRLLLGRDQSVYKHETKRQRDANHLPGRIQGLVLRLKGKGEVKTWV
jgi:hypothetical protein